MTFHFCKQLDILVQLILMQFCEFVHLLKVGQSMIFAEQGSLTACLALPSAELQLSFPG
jgi:hypothetical protein